MPTYITKTSNIASRDEFIRWQQLGYFTGSFENYLALALPNKVFSGKELTWDKYQNLIKQFPPQETTIFWSGDLGPHCSECAGFGDNLCDYPVGDDKTCDRLMCEGHSKKIGNDLHYCKAHYEEWCRFRDSGGVNTELSNVVAIGSEKLSLSMAIK